VIPAHPETNGPENPNILGDETRGADHFHLRASSPKTGSMPEKRPAIAEQLSSHKMVVIPRLKVTAGHNK
jgi:hypothetical protein